MKVLKFKEWCLTETCQSSTKGIENDNAEPSYSYGNIKDILGNKYNYSLSSDKPLQEFEEEFLSAYDNPDIDMNDEYFAKSFIEYTKNQKRLTPPFQDDTITNNDFFAKSYYEENNKLDEDGGVACATGGNTSGMGAVVTSQPSSIPGDVAGATTGSGDVGSGFVNRNVRSRPKPRGASKTQKEKIVSSLKNMANSYSDKTDTYKKAGDKDATSMKPKGIKSFFDFSKS